MRVINRDVVHESLSSRSQTSLCKRPVEQRTGAVAVVAVIVTIIVGMTGALLVKSVLTNSQQRVRLGWQQQAALIADGGWLRARLKLADNAAWNGDSWTVPADVLGNTAGQPMTAIVETSRREQPGTSATTASKKGATELIVVVTRLAAGEQQVVQITRTYEWPFGASTPP